MRMFILLATVMTTIFVSFAYANGATVIREFSCVISPAASGLPIPLFTTETHSVTTPSGNTILKCKFDIPDIYIPDATMRHSGFPCNTYLGLTTDSMSVTSVGGKVMLDCKIVGN